MNRNRILIGWVLVMLALTAVMTRFPIRRMPWIVRRIYLSEKVHVALHLLLFAVLAYLIASVLWRRMGRRGLSAIANWRLVALFGLILVVGVAQEVVQLRARGLHEFRIHEVFDLVVDLVGASAGLLCFHVVRWLRVTPRRDSAQSPP